MQPRGGVRPLMALEFPSVLYRVGQTPSIEVKRSVQERGARLAMMLILSLPFT
jgi:hypothetical protein